MIPTAMRDEVSNAPQGRVGSAIARASARTGVDFTYLLNQAKVESGLDPNARARTSSATGLFQFIDQTWLGTVRKHGAEHGLGWAAAAIRQGSNGRYRVADPATRRAILDLRRQPEAASAMAAEFASDNKSYLEGRLGRAAEPVDLYLAHFLGAGGASQFLRAHDAAPGAPAAGILPAAARANRAVFYDRDGSPRSFAEIRTRFASKIGGAAAPLPRPLPARSQFPEIQMAALAPETQSDQIQSDFPALRMAALAHQPQPLTRPSPQYARLAYLMLAQLGG